MSENTIKHESKNNSGSFYLEKDSNRLAEMIYEMEGSDKLTIKHTEVDPSLKGQGVGTKLLEKLVEFARKESFKVASECSFADAMFKKKESLRDVLL